MKTVSFFALIILVFGCKSQQEITGKKLGELENNLRFDNLNYSGVPTSPSDRTPLTFSDEGAWFSYGFSDSDSLQGGFTGPFLMTQENGVWASKMLSQLNINEMIKNRGFVGQNFKVIQHSYPSHLEQIYSNDYLKITQRLFFANSSTAFIITLIENTSDQNLKIQPIWKGVLMSPSLSLDRWEGEIRIKSNKSTAVGFINYYNRDKVTTIANNEYEIKTGERTLKKGEIIQIKLEQSFEFPENIDVLESDTIADASNQPTKFLQRKINYKSEELSELYSALNPAFTDDVFHDLTTKSYLTLQNNWRAPAGELKHAGLFPSYNYEWFHGFWAWDSWKHAVALARYNPDLAKDQIRAMYDFQEENGFIPDCIYRDTTIEKHNYRNTKPPLSAWAVWNSQDGSFDRNYLSEMYHQLIKQHEWWYENRDHDGDGLCEYGSTDGTLIAAKWESGMDNAVRFDNSKILKNKDGAYSLNQESVDLNAYLAAEKYYLSLIANNLFSDDAEKYKAEFESLKLKIQEQFFDEETGWFYDTNLDGTEFIKAMGCEGWIPLWANVATSEQAETVKNNMMDTSKFNLTLPFQTLSADHPKFKPDGGYWRGPIWLDQCYFGIAGLRNYGFELEASKSTRKLLVNCDGLLQKGPSIRENYNPVTGEGLEAHNFSWSASHIILLMIGHQL